MSLSRHSGVLLLVKALVKTLKVEVEFLHQPVFPCIVAFWHGRMLLLPFALKDYAPKVHILVSRHRDGELVAGIVERLGFSTIRGSTGKGKGGDRAFAQMLNVLKRGDVVAITPDGPRGPAEVAKPGVAKLSMLSGAPIYPLTFSASKGTKLSSWDGFLLPYPFSRCKVVLGKPIYPEGSEDELAKRVELELKKLTRSCDGEVR